MLRIATPEVYAQSRVAVRVSDALTDIILFIPDVTTFLRLLLRTFFF